MTWFAARGRLTEDWLAQSQARQYVILGAGLDSFAWRQPGNVRVYEIDEPSSQRWKQERAAAIGLPVRNDLTWIPLDLEARALALALKEAGVDSSRGLFVSWLGVIPYLTRDAIRENLEQLPPCQLAVAYVPEGGTLGGFCQAACGTAHRDSAQAAAGSGLAPRQAVRSFRGGVRSGLGDALGPSRRSVCIGLARGRPFAVRR